MAYNDLPWPSMTKLEITKLDYLWWHLLTLNGNYNIFFGIDNMKTMDIWQLTVIPVLFIYWQSWNRKMYSKSCFKTLQDCETTLRITRVSKGQQFSTNIVKLYVKSKIKSSKKSSQVKIPVKWKIKSQIKTKNQNKK